MRTEHGSATVWAAFIVTGIVVVAVIGWQIAQLVGLRHQASAGADLAALAASRASLAGTAPCDRAEQVARDNDTILIRCRMDADVATVTARAESPRWWGGQWAVEQRARAAPVSYLPP